MMSVSMSLSFPLTQPSREEVCVVDKRPIGSICIVIVLESFYALVVIDPTPLNYSSSVAWPFPTPEGLLIGESGRMDQELFSATWDKIKSTVDSASLFLAREFGHDAVKIIVDLLDQTEGTPQPRLHYDRCDDSLLQCKSLLEYVHRHRTSSSNPDRSKVLKLIITYFNRTAQSLLDIHTEALDEACGRIKEVSKSDPKHLCSNLEDAVSGSLEDFHQGQLAPLDKICDLLHLLMQFECGPDIVFGLCKMWSASSSPLIMIKVLVACLELFVREERLKDVEDTTRERLGEKVSGRLFKLIKMADVEGAVEDFLRTSSDCKGMDEQVKRHIKSILHYFLNPSHYITLPSKLTVAQLPSLDWSGQDDYSISNLLTLRLSNMTRLPAPILKAADRLVEYVKSATEPHRLAGSFIATRILVTDASAMLDALPFFLDVDTYEVELFTLVRFLRRMLYDQSSILLARVSEKEALKIIVDDEKRKSGRKGRKRLRDAEDPDETEDDAEEEEGGGLGTNTQQELNWHKTRDQKKAMRMKNLITKIMDSVPSPAPPSSAMSDFAAHPTPLLARFLSTDELERVIKALRRIQLRHRAISPSSSLVSSLSQVSTSAPAPNQQAVFLHADPAERKIDLDLIAETLKPLDSERRRRITALQFFGADSCLGFGEGRSAAKWAMDFVVAETLSIMNIYPTQMAIHRVSDLVSYATFKPCDYVALTAFLEDERLKAQLDD